LQPDL